MYRRKTRDIWEVQGYYSPQYGYETVTSEDTRREALVRLHEYQENESGIAFRLKKVREPIEQADN